jgi:Phage integrase, N-terminal SAM-like domain
MSKVRVYRRCSCRGDDGRQLGACCSLLLSNRKHGTWTFAVDMPSVDNRRRTMRRGGYPTKGAAQRALIDVVARYGAGVKVNDRETVANYLTAWLEGKRHALKPKTMYRYTEIVTKDLTPALGGVPGAV